LQKTRLDLTPRPFHRSERGAAHLLQEHVVIRFDGGAD
jgi:hypothetical protein